MVLVSSQAAEVGPNLGDRSILAQVLGQAVEFDLLVLRHLFQALQGLLGDADLVDLIHLQQCTL